MGADEAGVLERYERQLRIEGWDQEKLTRSSVAVVGVGATGCELSKNLALMGVGKLILIDNDVIELSNLSRQMLFTDDDLGKPKAVVAAEKLKKMNPWIEVESYFDDVRNLDEAVFEKVSAIASCLDNWPVRRWVNSLSVELDKPLVDVAMEGFYANLQVVIPGKTACLECHGEELIPKEVQLAECTLRRRKPEDLVNDLRESGVELSVEIARKLFEQNIKTVYDLKYAQEDVLRKLDDEARKAVRGIREKLKPKMPALQSVAALIAGVASTEIVKILHEGGLGEPVSGLLVYDGLSGRFTITELERNPECFVCGDLVREKAVSFPVKPNETIIDLKRRIAERFSIPDPEILYRRWRLADAEKVSEVGFRSGDLIYVNTSRRFMPLPLRIVVEDSEA